jgi:hypothetical protein
MNGGTKVMNWFWMAIVLAIVGTIGILYFLQAGSLHAQGVESAEFREGQVFPTTVFPGVDGGRPSSVADFRGNKLILHIFASW